MLSELSKANINIPEIKLVFSKGAKIHDLPKKELGKLMIFARDNNQGDFLIYIMNILEKEREEKNRKNPPKNSMNSRRKRQIEQDNIKEVPFVSSGASSSYSSSWIGLGVNYFKNSLSSFFSVQENQNSPYKVIHINDSITQPELYQETTSDYVQRKNKEINSTDMLGLIQLLSLGYLKWSGNKYRTLPVFPKETTKDVYIFSQVSDIIEKSEPIIKESVLAAGLAYRQVESSLQLPILEKKLVKELRHNSGVDSKQILTEIIGEINFPFSKKQSEILLRNLKDKINLSDVDKKYKPANNMNVNSSLDELINVDKEKIRIFSR